MVPKNRFLNALQLLFKIQPGEGYQVAVMFGYSLLAIGGVMIIGRSISRIIFLSQLPPSFTPYKFILPPLFVVLATAVYTRFTTRLPISRLIILFSLLMAVGTLGFWLLLTTAAANSFPLLAAFYVFIEILAALVGIQFWTFAADIFDARQAKRLFGLIAAGGVLSNVLAGIGLQTAAQVFAPADLLFVVIASLLGCAAAVFFLARRQTAETAVVERPAAESQPQSGLREDLRKLWQTPLLVSVGSIMITMSLVTNITDYQLDLSLQRFFAADGEAMLSFMGLFQIVTGLLAIGVQLFATNRLMERFGLVTSLLILPLSIAAGSGLILATGGILLAAAWPRGSDVVFRYTVNDAALNTLSLPIEPIFRRRAKAILDGIVKPPIVGLLGLSFLLFTGDGSGGGTTIMLWSLPVLGLTAVWLFLVQRVRGQYRVALADSLRQRRLDLSSLEVDVSDETTVQVLVQSLQNEDELQVIHALKLMQQTAQSAWLPHIAPLLDHASLEVRLLVLQMLQDGGQSAYAPLIAEQFNAASLAVRAAAIESYCALLEDSAVEAIIPFLDAEETEIRTAAIVGLTRYGGLDGILQAATYLKEMLTAEVAEMRRQGANILGQLGVPSFYRPLLPLLDDPSSAVQLAAIQAAGTLRHPAFIPHLIAKLGVAATASAASEALVGYQTAVIEPLAAAWEDETGTAVRLQIPRVLGHIQAEAAVPVLAAHLEDVDEHIRGRVLRALTRLQSVGVPVEMEASYLRRLLLQEARHHYDLAVLYEDLGESGRGVLLGDSLRTRMAYTIDRLFYLFRLLYPEQNMAQLRRGLTQEDSRLRANAIELLDTVATREVKQLVLPLIESSPERILSLAQSELEIPSYTMTERLTRLSSHPSGWIRACTLFRIGELGLMELRELVAAGLEDADALVRETAVCASQRLLPSAQFRELLRQKTAADSEQVRRYADKLLVNMGQNVPEGLD